MVFYFAYYAKFDPFSNETSLHFDLVFHFEYFDFFLKLNFYFHQQQQFKVETIKQFLGSHFNSELQIAVFIFCFA